MEALNESDRQEINRVTDASPGRPRRCVDRGEEKLGASEGVSSLGAGDTLMGVDK